MNEEQKAAAAEQAKRDRASALTIEKLAESALKAGADPKYVAHRYGFPVERCEKYLRSLEQKEEAKRSRVAANSGGV